MLIPQELQLSLDISQQSAVKPAIPGVHALDILQQVHLACADHTLQKHVIDFRRGVHQFHVLVHGIHAVCQGEFPGIDMVVFQRLLRNPFHLRAGGFEETGKDGYRKHDTACQVAGEPQIGLSHFGVIFRFHVG